MTAITGNSTGTNGSELADGGVAVVAPNGLTLLYQLTAHLEPFVFSSCPLRSRGCPLVQDGAWSRDRGSAVRVDGV
jgi:hypothetical protein